jgi:hypothetical protein
MNKETNNTIEIDVSDFYDNGVSPVNKYDRECDFSNPKDIIMSMNGDNFCTNVYQLWLDNDKENIKNLKSESFDDRKDYWEKSDDLFSEWCNRLGLESLIKDFYEFCYDEPFNLKFEKVSV